jgi:Fe-S cluster assembly protein SufD
MDRRKLSEIPETLPAGPAWLGQIREGAADAVRTGGLPHKKVEAWRFTPVRPIVDTAYAGAPEAEPPAELLGVLPDDGGARVVSVNGRLIAPDGLPDGVEVASLAELLAGGGDQLAGLLGRIAPREHFAALNAALFTGGLLVRIGRGVRLEAPLHVVHVAVPGDGATVSYPRLLLVADEQSEATVIESYLAADGDKQLTNAVTEVDLAPSANLEHVRVQRGTGASHHVGMLAVRQARASVYRSYSASLGGAFARMDVRVLLAGEGAECAVDGVYLTGGSELCDHHTFIDHAAPRCSSTNTYRGIVDGSSHAIFDGTIVVRRDSQHTSAHQENRNLLLSDDATVHTKPHLEIDADDIVASHGATVGALDDEQLFYLRSRGIDETDARAALTYGFVKEILDRLRSTGTARWLGMAVRDRLPGGDRIGAMVKDESEELS